MTTTEFKKWKHLSLKMLVLGLIHTLKLYHIVLKWIKYYLTTALKFLLCMTKNSQILRKSFLKKLNDKINPIKSKHWSFMMTGI